MRGGESGLFPFSFVSRRSEPVLILLLLWPPSHSFSYASVLISVRKSDEALRKIRKSRTKTPFSLFSSSSSSSSAKAASEQEAKEEDNIKLQLLLDVEGLRKDAEEMGVKVKQSKAFGELKQVVLADGEYWTSGRENRSVKGG